MLIPRIATLSALLLSCCGLFVTPLAALERPTLVSPGSRGETSQIADRCPTFSWAGSPRAESLELLVYEVVESEGGESEDEAAEPNQEPIIWVRLPGGAHTWTPGLAQCLTPGATYEWTVGQKLPGGELQWSNLRRFEVSPPPAAEEVEEALAVLRRYLASSRKPDGVASDLREVSPQVASDPITEWKVNLGANSSSGTPGSETTMHIQNDVDDNFGILVDSFGVPGSEIGLHAGSARYASLAKNGFFEAGSWNRFDEGTGAYLQEVEPDGDVAFLVAPAGTNPIIWNTVMRFSADGLVGVGQNPFLSARFHSSGGNSLHGVSGFSDALFRSGVEGGSSAASGYGVRGFNLSSTGAAWGVYGVTLNSSTGSGVVGRATPEGTNNGVYGSSDSMTGRGVFGQGAAFSGTNIGVLGESNSPDGFGIYGKSLNNNFAGFFKGKVGVDGMVQIGPSGDLVTLDFDAATDTLTADRDLSLSGDLAANQVILENKEAISNARDGTIKIDATYLQIPTGSPAVADCDAADEIGRLVYDSSSDRFFVCDDSGWLVV